MQLKNGVTNDGGSARVCQDFAPIAVEGLGARIARMNTRIAVEGTTTFAHDGLLPVYCTLRRAGLRGLLSSCCARRFAPRTGQTAR